MLTQMILSAQSLLVAAPRASADYVVANDAEWNAVFANTAATLAGKIVEIVGDNFTQREITDKDIWAAGGRLTIRGANQAAKLPSVILNGVVRGIDFAALNFQMKGWPASWAACVIFNNGTFGKLRFLNGTSFRHGYGTSLVDFDTDADLPEYERVSNVRTATTTSQTFPLTWKSAAAPSGWIEFFNRGTSSVRVAVGGSGVVATGTSQLVASGARARLQTGISPGTSTHFAVLATSGTSEVNARTEIGLSAYLSAAFQQTGAAIIEDIELRGCVFRDLDNGLKGLRPRVSLVAMDCDFDRIYQDIISLAPDSSATSYFLRNIESLPFSRSGIAEDLQGDARDPHGDQCQLFSNSGTGAIGPVFYAGNRIRLTPRRPGAQSQGIFWSDNDVDPCFDNLYIISTMQTGGATRAISIGEAGTPFKTRNAFIYGATLIDGRDPSATGPTLTIDHDGDGSVYVGKCLAPAMIATDAPLLLDGNLAGVTPAILPTITNLSAANDRASIDAAMTTVGVGAGIGAAATGNAIDWETSDHTAVIRWDVLPSGAHWNTIAGQPISTLITLPLRKILNRRAGQTVSVGAGTEWRKVAADGTTELQSWTTASGTIEPDQFIQIRGMTAVVSAATSTLTVTINGFQQTVTTVTSDTPATPLIQPALLGYFVDQANVPPAVNRMTFRGWFRFAGSVPNTVKPFAQASTGCDLIVLSTGALNATVEDGAGLAVLLNAQVAPPGTIKANIGQRIVFDVNQVTKEVRLTVDNATFVTPFAVPGNGTFQSNRQASFLASATGLTALPSGTQFGDLSLDYNGVTYKTISNLAALANADPWKAGTGVFTN